MSDNFYNVLWELGNTNPDIREAIAKSISKGSGGYSIPTRQKSNLTGEVETIHLTIQELIKDFDEAHKEYATDLLKQADNMRVGDLEKLLSLLRVELIAKEVKGTPLTNVEKTLRDIDISNLALTTLVACNQIPKKFDSPEEFKEEWERNAKKKSKEYTFVTK